MTKIVERYIVEQLRGIDLEMFGQRKQRLNCKVDFPAFDPAISRALYSSRLSEIFLGITQFETPHPHIKTDTPLSSEIESLARHAA